MRVNWIGRCTGAWIMRISGEWDRDTVSRANLCDEAPRLGRWGDVELSPYVCGEGLVRLDSAGAIAQAIHERQHATHGQLIVRGDSHPAPAPPHCGLDSPLRLGRCRELPGRGRRHSP